VREEGQIIIIAIIAIAIAFAGESALNFYKYGGDLYVEKYTAYLSPEGNLTEDYEYGVYGNYRMLYRVWNAPLIYEGELNKPYIKILEINCSYIPYIKDYYGNVFASSYKEEIAYLAFRNEAGCFNPSGYKHGKYSVQYKYIIYPPVNYDNNLYHMNIKLADKHVPYRDVEIVLDNSSGSIVNVYSHPPMEMERNGDFYIIHGKSQKNGMIEVEMLFRNASPKFLYHEDGLMEKVREENNAYRMKYEISLLFSSALKYLTLLFPLIIFAIYYLHGREKKYTIPRYLSTIPKKRKPWMVNLVFKGDAMDFDMHGFYATLLDLHRRGIIEIENEGKELKIKILKDKEMDWYEKKVIRFLKKYSINGAFSTEKLKEKIRNYKGDTYNLSKIQNDFNDIRRVRNGSEFIINGRYTMLKFFAASLLLFLLSAILFAIFHQKYPPLLNAMIYSLLLSIQFLITIPAPSTLFGKWRKDYYREKLEWNSFKRFLLDMAHLEKYEMKDINMWKEWLVYATALGIGKKVAKQLKKMNIPIPEANMIPYVYIAFASTSHTLSTTYSSSTGGGGGIGAGGGFGGGGAGGR